MSDENHHITLAGARNGRYRIDEELPDGRLLISPEAEPVLTRAPARPMTDEEHNALLAEHGPNMIPFYDEE